MVLIETLWNVKTCLHRVRVGHSLRINRNIMECKVVWNTSVLNRENCINRNIMECKAEQRTIISGNYQSINRNIMECKDQSI